MARRRSVQGFRTPGAPGAGWLRLAFPLVVATRKRQRSARKARTRTANTRDFENCGLGGARPGAIRPDPDMAPCRRWGAVLFGLSAALWAGESFAQTTSTATSTSTTAALTTSDFTLILQRQDGDSWVDLGATEAATYLNQARCQCATPVQVVGTHVYRRIFAVSAATFALRRQTPALARRREGTGVHRWSARRSSSAQLGALHAGETTQPPGPGRKNGLATGQVFAACLAVPVDEVLIALECLDARPSVLAGDAR
jgi:hypothetical protein